MDRDLVISVSKQGIDTALLEDKLLVEYRQDKPNASHLVGDIYLGRVRKLMPGLNAAFIDVDCDKDGFIHYQDLGEDMPTINQYLKKCIETKGVSPSLEKIEYAEKVAKNGNISEQLVVGAPILVQINKESISTKGPRLSTEISLAGRYIVLMPFSSQCAISQRIRSKEERSRLRKIVQGICPKNFGAIIRTNAANKTVAELEEDFRQLYARWAAIVNKLSKGDRTPQCLDSEQGQLSVLLRDMLNADFTTITVNDESCYNHISEYMGSIAPEKQSIVKLYTGQEPIFDHFGVTRQIKGAFGRIVNLKGGIYLIIERTEALHVIDVNSGHRLNADNNQEANAIAVNLEAAKEIARQLRLRDIGGIIVVDFIDLRDQENRKLLYETMKTEMAKDRARHSVLPPSKFGLIQITRQRVREEISVETRECCPTCQGTGKIQPAIFIANEIENHLHYLIQQQGEKHITICVHPVLYAYLTKGLFSIACKWRWHFKKYIRIVSRTSMPLLNYKFLNKHNEELSIE